ncbi:MAG TPA: hypothetical protein VMT09_00370 [Steroidobacteraceae bacterium]|nr:hypothetical protein [Steroidobacteraceae bacterium]
MKRLTLARAVAAACGAIAASHASAAPPEDLSACGAIADPTERLACYDRLAGRPAAPAPAPAKPAGAMPPPAAAPPPVVAAPAAAPPPAPAAAAPASSAKPAAGAAAATSFGSYSAEHPTAPALPQTLSARVIAMGKTIDGRPTVTLEGGALWLLDEADPLLAVGDTVTISRGAFNSFLLETSTRRLHHVRRIS